MLCSMPEAVSYNRILSAIQADPWAIQPEALERIVTIAQGLGEGPEALLAKLGRPLDNSHNVIRRDTTAIIQITGPIFRRANLLTNISGATSVEMLARDFDQAVSDPSIRSIILEIDSPGGQVAGVSEFAAQVREAAGSKHQIVAYVSDLGASAAYWIASAADRIVTRDTARLGSIGVIMQVAAGGNDRSIKFVSSQSPRKHAAPDSDLGRSALQAEVDALAQVFIDSVAGYRGVDPETVIEKFGQGGVFVGQAAVDAGLADRLGSLESLIAELNGESTKRSTTMTAKANTPPVTRELLAAEYPDLLAAILEEGMQSGINDGAELERARIQSIEAAELPGHESLIASLKFDGKTTGAQAALAVIKAEKELAEKRKESMRSGHSAYVPFAPSDPAPNAADKAKDDEARRDKIESATATLFNQFAGVQ